MDEIQSIILSLKLIVYVHMNIMFECKIVNILNILLFLSFNIWFGTQKNHLIETLLLSTHNMYLVERYNCVLLYRGMICL